MTIFYFIWGIWFLFEIFLSQKKRTPKELRTDQDKGSFNVLWLAILFGISLAIILMMNFYVPISKIMVVPYIGLLVIILGLIIRIVSIKTLAENFSTDVNVRKSQKLMTTGIYKKIRHPAYMGTIISFIGLGLSLNNWLALITIVLPVVGAFLYRIKIEENVLIEYFGDEYINYSKKTKKLLPFIF